METEQYEGEFAEWCIINIIKNRYGIYVHIETMKAFATIGRVYQYWLDNIKK